jgi:proliferating cell nuclear antigen
MFEARLVQGKVLKQIIEAIKDLVVDANIDCSEDEVAIQSMDSSHVALVAVCLQSNGFDHFRCDRSLSLGFNSANMSKILKIAGNDDIITLKAEDDGDALTLMFESPAQDRIADFGMLMKDKCASLFYYIVTHSHFFHSLELKLMDIENEQLGIPDTPYKCSIKMPSAEFQRIIRDLQVLGETCTISCTKEGIRFSVQGDLGTGNVLTRSNTTAEKEEQQVIIQMEEPVELNFALRYLNFFTKATALSPTVMISMSPDVPIVVEYPIEDTGYVKYFLAPKIDEEG